MAEKKGQTIIIKKKKGGGGHGHHGGAWKVAYADFVTAMMAFFMVMWLMGTDEETKAAIAHYFNHPNTPWQAGGDPKSKEPYPTGNQVGSGENILTGDGGQVPDDLAPPDIPPVRAPKEFQELSELVQEVFPGQLVAMDVSIDSMKFSVPEALFFQPGSSTLRKDAPKSLDKLGQILRGYKGHITIAAHGREVTAPDKGGHSNPYEFTMARSVAVMEYLVENRWAPEDQISPTGAGLKREVASASGEAKDPNRIEFTLSRGK